MFAGALVFMLVFNCADSSAILATTSITGCDLVSKGNTVTWGEASSFCQSMGGRLCSRKEYCPNGRNRAPLQGIKSTTESHWAPVADFSNGWVMLSNSTGDEPCAMNTEVSSDLNQNAVFNPSWGFKPENKPWKGYVKCCNVPKKNTQNGGSNAANDKCIVHAFNAANAITPASYSANINTENLGKAFDTNSTSKWICDNRVSAEIKVDVGTTSTGDKYCLQRVKLSWSDKYSPQEFIILVSLDGVGFFEAKALLGAADTLDRVDDVQFASPVPARYLKIQTNERPRNGALHLVSVLIYGGTCAMRLQSRSTVSVDFGPTGQEIPSSWEALTLPTENGMPYNDLVKLRVSSSAAKIFSKNKTSIDVSLGCSETGGTGIRLIGGKTTAEFTSIADVKTLRDGVRSPGTMNVVVNGVQPGYYEISSRHHEFDGSGQVFINSIVEGEAVGHGIVSSTGYGNLSLLDPRFGLHSSLLHIPKSSNSNIDISFVSFQSDRTTAKTSGQHGQSQRGT